MLVPEFHVTTAAFASGSTVCEEIEKLSIIGYLYAHLPFEKISSLAPVALENVTAIELALKNQLLDARVILGPFTADMMEVATSWLDQGIQKVLITAESSDDKSLEKAIIAISELPASRVVLRIPVDLHDPTSNLQDKLQRVSKNVSGVVLAIGSPLTQLLNDDEFDPLFQCLQTLRKSVPEEFFFAVEWPAAKEERFDRSILIPRIAKLHRQHINVVLAGASQLKEHSVDLIDVSQCFVKCLHSDRPDGLFTTVVADEAGVALGLVYSSEASVLAAIESSRGVYYSRSRNGLWKKGESSGNSQKLLQLDVDCDSDALRFTVEQTGAGFCHLNTRTCWGEAGGLQALEAMLKSRLRDAPPGSYTKRLFNDPTLLRNKLVEEAQELAEAETIPDVAGEAADVLYFAMVRCVAAGATLNDVAKMLDKRALKVSRRPGNSKAYRIEAAAEILQKK